MADDAERVEKPEKASKSGRRRGHGEGTIYKRADGRYSAQISLPDGKRKTYYAKTQAEVRRKLAAAIAKQDAGVQLIRDERLNVATYLEDWLERVKPTIRPRTWIRYRQLLAHVSARLGKVKLAKLAPAHVERLYAQLLDSGLSSTTVHHLHTVLHHALSDALRKGDVQSNVTELVDAPRIRNQNIKYWTPEQARQFLASVAGDRLEALYALVLSTGMRQGELLGLHWRDVDLDGATLQVRTQIQRITGRGFVFDAPKTQRGRRLITLTSLAIDALRHHRVRQAEERLAMGPAWEDTDLVFPNTVGKPMEGGHLLRRAFQPLAKRLGLPPLRFHGLRHTAATLMLVEGIHPKVVAEMLGHSQISVTLNTYSHVLPNMQKDAAAALDRVLRVPPAVTPSSGTWK